ncbi:MAG: hypothetical protein A3I77_00535 [Gammaproteobacteria bacterium RIFCSPLOWO2_02_FULL_42_14]|nr:MAG: hypothetical protein A3B71_08620 [Gammaproteobacteria bacterium RIFCSPHIGHO2_02_FULL_42_43]OGT29290.1 MAG: hypothetical protein A2624_04615 [Gammaproteobacteria bacterium RIFCSPHIGHO2_01_FULL_42_8]OGT50770.1 MAG: hypothetical protein A3E54_00815 [Gammaproteobacteria bacterium RIFCSPHIGHO2_12_FULL_41_25]OGT61755.1 MAG: hypothetical protein A3I77_00535 [Gammaproteobacteria bacterium RIFCSPLOWO2_02_FULL_42_14]OGT85499.1 MAG: hypothetical protein A3G86_06725 [Gammaproteobacteria bacterium R
MKIIVRGMLLWLMLFTAAFAEKITVTSPEKPIIVHSVKQRDFVIALAANPTTGYSWFLQSFDDKLIVPVHQKFIHPENKKLMGAGGLSVWTFRIQQTAFIVPQTTNIEMVYKRPWSNEDETVQKFRVVID